MPTYINLLKWTDEGARNAKDSVKRAEDLTKLFERIGGRVIGLYWTQGAYDLVVIGETPDEDTSLAGSMLLATSGLVRSETMRAYSVDDMRRVLGKLG